MEELALDKYVTVYCSTGRENRLYELRVDVVISAYRSNSIASILSVK